MRRHLLPLLLAALIVPGFAPGAPGAVSSGVRSGDAPTTYVVVLDAGTREVAAAAEALLAPFQVAPTWLYDDAFTGFATRLTPAQAAHLTTLPGVASVEADRRFDVAGAAVPTGVARVGAVSTARAVRVDADVAFLDTGVDAQHPDLRIHDRVDCTRPVTVSEERGWVATLVVTSRSEPRTRRVCAPDGGDDARGHGTHVAGVIGAKDDGRGVLGVAPGVRLWSVKVIADDGGTTSEVLAGLEHVTEHADELEVVNLSFVARGRSEAVDEAIAGATAKGLVVVAAAGNHADPASWYSPANAPNAITVSAITDLDGRPGGRQAGDCEGGDDRFATYSNYGRAVDLAAPGSCILSTAVGGGTARFSGTSVAAPHVTGAVARYLAREPLGARSRRWERAREALLTAATPQAGPCGFRGGRSREPLLRIAPC